MKIQERYYEVMLHFWGFPDYDFSEKLYNPAVNVIFLTIFPANIPNPSNLTKNDLLHTNLVGFVYS